MNKNISASEWPLFDEATTSAESTMPSVWYS